MGCRIIYDRDNEQPMNRRSIRSCVVSTAAFVLMCLLVSACEAPAESQASSSNRKVQVELLTTFEGVKLYRVLTGDRTVYVAVADRGQLSASWLERQGKTSVLVETSTVIR